MNKLAFILFSGVLMLNSCIKKQDPNVFKNLSYGSDQRNKVDVYLPEERDTNTAVVLLIHGGAWVAGNKEDWGAEVRYELLDEGYAVAMMNYRYACGDFHKQMEDVKNAIGLIRSRATEWEISDSKFALMGGSAGGHLSLLYGHAFDTDEVVKAVISWVGPTDMTDSVFHQYATNYNIFYVFEQFFGNTYTNNPQLYEDGSPIFNTSDVPTLFLAGGLDDLVPHEQSIRMFDTLVVHGVAADTTIFYNSGHDLFGPGQVNKTLVYDEVRLWLATYLN